MIKYLKATALVIIFCTLSHKVWSQQKTLISLIKTVNHSEKCATEMNYWTVLISLYKNNELKRVLELNQHKREIAKHCPKEFLKYFVVK